jgi:hypothetical protein
LYFNSICEYPIYIHRRTAVEKLGGRAKFARFLHFARQSNSLLNVGNFRKAKSVWPHCPIFLHFLLLSYIFLVFQFIFPTFSNLRSTFARLTFKIGASVAKWLAHLPFTSEAAGSNLTEYFPNATRTQSSCEKSKSQRSAESRGFSPGTPVSSHRES